MMPTVGWTFVTYEKLKPNIKYQLKFGGVAQLGEHLPCKQGVRSSILLISTIPQVKPEGIRRIVL